MNMTTKKVLASALIAVLALAAWSTLDSNNLHVNIDGEELDGPLGAMLGLLFAGGGLLLAAVVVSATAVLLGLLFAGLGLMLVLGMALLALVLTAAISPLLLPLLIPAGLIWYFSSRARTQRTQAQSAAPV